MLMQSEAFTARFVTHALRCEYAHLAVYLLLTTYYLRLTTYGLLLTTYYLLLTTRYAHLAVVVRLPKLPGTVLLLEADPEAHLLTTTHYSLLTTHDLRLTYYLLLRRTSSRAAATPHGTHLQIVQPRPRLQLQPEAQTSAVNPSLPSTTTKQQNTNRTTTNNIRKQ